MNHVLTNERVSKDLYDLRAKRKETVRHKLSDESLLDSARMRYQLEYDGLVSWFVHVDEKRLLEKDEIRITDSIRTFASTLEDGISQKLASEMAIRLRDVVPPEFVVTAHSYHVNIVLRYQLVGGSAAAIVVDQNDGRPLVQKLESAILSILGGVQDYIIESLQRAWPTTARGKLCMPGARSDGKRLHLWYGDFRNPVVVLPSIDIQQLSNEKPKS